MIAGASALNTVDLALIAVLLLGLAIGAAQGVIRQALALLSFYVALVIAAQYHGAVARALSGVLPGDPVARSSVVLLLTFLIIGTVLNGLSYYIYRQTSLAGYSWLDRSAGAVLGFVLSWGFAGLLLAILAFAMGASWQDWEADRVLLEELVNRSALAPLARSVLPGLFATLRPWLPQGMPAPFVL